MRKTSKFRPKRQPKTKELTVDAGITYGGESLADVAVTLHLTPDMMTQFAHLIVVFAESAAKGKAAAQGNMPAEDEVGAKRGR